MLVPYVNRQGFFTWLVCCVLYFVVLIIFEMMVFANNFGIIPSLSINKEKIEVKKTNQQKDM